jgi:hypothetical protein
MKKLLLVTICIVSAVSLMQAQVSVGVHANGILAGGSIKEEDIKLKQKSRFSWKFGVVANIGITEQLSFMPQLNVLSKGGKIDSRITESYEGINYTVETKGKNTLTYVELPLNIVYTMNGFFAGAGPSLSYGIGGKSNGTVTSYDEDGTELDRTSEDADVKFDGKKNQYGAKLHLKALEFGANFVAGYRFENGISVMANFNLGLSDIHPDDHTKWKNNYFGIGVAYYFLKGNK